MTKDYCMLFTLIRSAVFGNPISDAEKNDFLEQVKDIMSLAIKHDIAHLVGFAVSNNSLVISETELSKAISSYTIKAVLRQNKLEYELAELIRHLETIEVPFIPLKGSVLRYFYPEPWMRTSCDIDILVPKSEVDRVAEYLSLKGYNKKGKGTHDISLFSAGGIHIELHFKLAENGSVDTATPILDNVWSYACLKDGSSFHYEMSDEMFYFYHVSHMAKHFENGGCGIRSVLDLWILDNLDGAHKEKRDALLEKGGLLRFADNARRLSLAWFGNEPHTSLTEQMQDYIIKGGVYGTYENMIALKQQQKGGKLGYLLSKIIIPYNTIKYYYPILQKHKWLTPIMQVRRWFKLAFSGHAKRVARELSYNQFVSKSDADKMKKFLDDIGL